jgi:hypothetical protein
MGIAECLKDMPAMGADNLTEECIVFSEGYSDPLGLLLPEAGAALDVGEQEGNRSAGKPATPGLPPR